MNRISSETADRFWALVDRSGECWEWLASKTLGYGRFWIDGKQWLNMKKHWHHKGKLFAPCRLCSRSAIEGR